MYNKVASIILNSAKSAGLSDVYVAQPDSLKENLAGKIFIIAEIGGKKPEGRKIFDFLIMALNDNYYNDEKILFRGKVEGLKIENIFEAAVTKTNKNLADFMAGEKIKLNPAATNITIGLIFENKLFFTNFGRNRALLVYRHGKDYEMINVEANAAESPQAEEDEEAEGTVRTPKLFSSVISGEIPLNSYFVFVSEALPEYISGKEMVAIITKLPPITAAEQIKNVLTKMNAYVPFLGVIIKNTSGQAAQETKDELEESLSAHGSVSSLNYTEQKTEQMLAPAGLISLPQILKKAKQLADQLKPEAPKRKSYLRAEEKSQTAPAPVELGQIKSYNMARSDSFFIKEKIIFKKKPGWLTEGLKNSFHGAINLLTPDFWTGVYRNGTGWVRRLDSRNRWLFLALGAFIIILVGSISFANWNNQRQKEADAFNDLVKSIQSKETSIDSHLLYNDETGAAQALIEAQALLSGLPQKTKDQKSQYQQLAANLETVANRIQKVIKAEPQKIADLGVVAISNLAFADGKIYGVGSQGIFDLSNLGAGAINISGATNLTKPFFDKSKDILYFQDGNRIIRLNLKTKTSSLSNVTLDPATTNYSIYGENLYTLADSSNRILKYAKASSDFGKGVDWLKEPVDLSKATDLGIDTNIYVLMNDGSIKSYKTGKAVDFNAAPLTPVMTSAAKIFVGTDHIYVFEAASKRLAVLGKKDGHLINQYIADQLANPTAAAVDEAGRAAYFLDGSAVYKISLNQ